jgi:hypothetical protein
MGMHTDLYNSLGPGEGRPRAPLCDGDVISDRKNTFLK